MNSDGFIERLDLIRGDLSARLFAQKVGISEGTLRSIRKGSSPTLETLLAICKGANVNIGWLTTGIGPMRPSDDQSTLPLNVITIPRVDVRLAAGTGALNGDHLETVEEIPFTREFLGGKLGRASQDGLIILTAQGDSMDPLIADGDLVMIDRKRNELADGVYAFVYGGMARVKRLRPTIQGDLELISQNPEYKDELLKRSDLEDFHIIGKVVWCGHRFS
ncbi:S24 family peptidase [Pseudovibrio exalbescens]|uniref:S24 family peptidase n=1 Tax=Pseudovibrio exalbescens TaxID=197461 RepID=UPI0015E152DB|nr:S24 family peptidase [Pseudovibrio exalbescens]MDD7908608.1 S24 family peptidase [Pseudovibrio exalbescens]